MNNLLISLKSKRQIYLLIASAFAALQLALALSLTGSVSAQQGPDPKVFVCKYVGTPNVDERLQTGNNPISVSQNAIKDFKGVGSYFNDAQGRSYVLAFDTGQAKPDVSQCPRVVTNPPANNNNGSVLGSTNANNQATPAAGGVGAGLGGGAGSIVTSAIGLVTSLGLLGYGATRLLRRDS